MAQLDRLTLKYSDTEETADFVTALQNGDIEGGAIEPGEIVLRRGNQFLEAWGLDLYGHPTQISVDIGGTVVPWNADELANVRLSAIGNVDVEDGIPDEGLGTAEAGWLLTWNGVKWVVRPSPAFGGEAGLIPTLNESGDVNYAFYATESNPKYQPELNDVLVYKYNPIAAKYYWAPTQLEIGELIDVDTFSSTINFRSNKYSRIQFGLESGIADNYGALNGGVGSVSITSQGQGVFVSGPGTSEFSQYGASGYIQLKAATQILISASQNSLGSPIIQYDENYIPDIFTNEKLGALTSLYDVRHEFGQSLLQDLGNVDATGIVTGSVLVYDAIAQQWKMGLGAAPDLSSASINELSDVDTSSNSGLGNTLMWDSVQQNWAPRELDTYFVNWDYFDFFGGTSVDNSLLPDEHSKPCDESNLGRITTVSNIPYICLRCRQDNDLTNNQFGYVRLLLDGNNSPVGANFPPKEYAQRVDFESRKDPLHRVAYEGQLGSLENVSTANAFPGGAIVYNGFSGFEINYPALDLNNYSVNELSDVQTYGAAIGYGLLWDGQNWASSSLDQRFRLDDMQDVNFGALGVANNKLVAAYMLVADPSLSYQNNEDVSSVLAVSAPKSDANLGSVRLFNSPNNYLYPYARYFGADSNWSIAQRLDNYIRWSHEPSWQTIDGDGCIEVFVYCSILLENRCIFRKAATQGNGGYTLRLMQNGALQWYVVGANGQSGFTINSTQNFVSLNNWHHIAVTKEGNLHSLYMDGALVGTATTDVIYTGDGVFALGRNDLDDANTLTHNFWRGYMLDFRVTRGRAKYSGSSYTVPYSIGAEIADVTPETGDFLSYDGSRWTNVAGLDADISANSINELADVDTTSNNPGTGDALVWTGNKWEPGIPGVGSTWALDDFTDVSSNYSGFLPWIRFDQATYLEFSPLYKNPEDGGAIISPGSSITISQVDGSYTCNSAVPNNNGPYGNGTSTYFSAGLEGQASIRAERITIQNMFTDCSIAGFIYHEDSLHYSHVPDRGERNNNPNSDISGQPEETYIPCWGVIQDHVSDILPYGELQQLGNVEGSPTQGQALAWDSTVSKWKPSSSIAADVSNNGIGDLADVSSSGHTEGYVLTFTSNIWQARPPLSSIFLFTDVDSYSINNAAPVNREKLFDTTASQTFGSGNNSNTILRLTDGTRGIAFANNVGYHYIYAGGGSHNPLILTSASTGTDRSFLEIGSTSIRIGDDGGQSCGSDGFSLARGWVIKYENVDLEWNDFSDDEIPNKESIEERLTTVLNDLDLTQYDIEELANVDGTNKQQGYALVWDGTNWVASNSVAADISASSIGQLTDVVKVDNSDSSTNDGSVSLDIGTLKTSRETGLSGGIALNSVNNDSVIGWSPTREAAPFLRNTRGTSGGSSVTVDSESVFVDAGNGIVYDRQPSLGNNSVPSWLQVRQQIIKSSVDYLALFLLGAEDFTDSAYGWNLSNSITSSPNPVYDSPFGGNYSVHFRKSSQDRIEWRSENGCPELWQAGQVWSIEFFIKVDSSTTGDGDNEFILAPVSPAGSTSDGLHVYLYGLDRSKIKVQFGEFSVENTNANAHLNGQLTLDAWQHVYIAQEGGGEICLYVAGTKVGTHLQTGSWGLSGGLAIGGREQSQSSDTRGYLTAQIDDLRITDKWLPYPYGASNVPVPVAPLQLSEIASVFGQLSMLEDVNTIINPPYQGQALIYNALEGYWEPGASPAADISSSSVGQLNDVNTANATPDNGDVLAWDSNNAEFRRTKVDGNGGIRPLVARSVVAGQVPSAGNLFAGELYLNMADRKLYALDNSGVAFNFATDGTYSDVTEIDGGLY